MEIVTSLDEASARPARPASRERLPAHALEQIIIAAGDGAKAALGAFDHLIRTPAALQ